MSATLSPSFPDSAPDRTPAGAAIRFEAVEKVWLRRDGGSFAALKGVTLDVPAGAIRAKTGWISEVYSLAGYMNLPSGGQLTFAFFVVGTVQPANREQLDAISAAAYRCGEQLADW